jgi:peroxiredoxin
MMTLVFQTFFPWMLIAVGTWLAYQLVRQNGRILLRLEAIEEQIGQRTGAPSPDAGGLPLGTLAPDFELPDLTGVRHKLSDFRGQNLLLVFFNPLCGFCTKIAADLSALPVEPSGQRPVPIVITTGDEEENQKLVVIYGIRCLVLLQEQMEVAAKYRAPGTPMGYRIDASGRIASELAVGAEPLLQLANSPALELNQADPDAAANGSSARVPKNNPSLARSRLNRTGLKAGAAAPEFRLPRIDGGELSLVDFRGEQVLLVFSDPECGPCDELAPQLQAIHLQQPELQVLMVSRRDLDVNRTKAARLGLSFPVVLQKQWEVSLKYAMFATPIAYLIDEQGILASDVAIGVAPIVALASKWTDESYSEEPSFVGMKDAVAI